ncbi:MAG: hypothetical protein U0Z26_16545 [Anaerolineales bacterium]
MDKIDKRNLLDTEVFTYLVSKEDRVFIYWRGKQVKVLKEQESHVFIGKIKNLDHKGAQLLMAKVTGNFKRANER